jgi:hypothetical protein
LFIAAVADDGLDIVVVARNAGRHSAQRQDASGGDNAANKADPLVDSITMLLYKKA